MTANLITSTTTRTHSSRWLALCVVLAFVAGWATVEFLMWRDL